ncbi:MAG TPA: hypothetical protein VK607_10520 [Kofleriaceae bacterium]|nr:hypothetical protein [Kofleriaceae bacterium]
MTARTRRFRAGLALAARDARDRDWQKVWAELAARYRRGELSDAELDRYLEVMP